MPVHPYQAAFVAGEVSEELDGRVDLDRIKQAVACARNSVPRVRGGLARRAGTIFCGRAKYDNKRARLIPFEFSRSVAYMLEVGELYIRFWTNRGLLRAASTTPAIAITLSATTGFTVTATAGAPAFTDTATDRGRRITLGAGVAEIRSVTSTTVATVAILADFAGTSLGSGLWTITGAPVEVVTSYVEADLPALRYKQIADVLYFRHQSYAPAKLVRVTATSFTFSAVSYNPPATYEAGLALTLSGSDTLTLSSAAVGSRTFTFAGAHAPFLPDADGSSDLGREITHGTGRGVITAVASTTVATVQVTSAFSGTSLTSGVATIEGSPYARVTIPKRGPVGASIGLLSFVDDDFTTEVDAFRSSDIGKYFVGGGGVAKIYAITSAKEAQATILLPFAKTETPSTGGTALDDPPFYMNAGAWTIESETWTAARGYPGECALVDGRLVEAGSIAEPDSIWGSVVGDYENHARGVTDEDAYDYSLALPKVNPIRALEKLGKRLIAWTLGGEYSLAGPNEEPITPTSPPVVEEQSQYGCDHDVDSLRAHQGALFVQRGGRAVREMAFTFEEDGYTGPQVSILAEHLLRDGLDEGAYVVSPDSTALFVTSGGELLMMTHEKKEQVIGWSHHVTGADQDKVDGIVESVAVIPNNCGTSDEVWLIVKRVIASATVRYVEVLDGGVLTDAALVYAGTAAATFRGLGHLEGETVWVVADDSTLYTTTVTNGEVSIATASADVIIGLNYVSRVVTLRPEWQTGVGTAQGRFKRWVKVVLRFFCTQGNVTVNGQAIDWAAHGITSFPYTGDVEIPIPDADGALAGSASWDRDGRLIIEQPEPLGFHLLAVTGAIETDDG